MCEGLAGQWRNLMMRSVPGALATGLAFNLICTVAEAETRSLTLPVLTSPRSGKLRDGALLPLPLSLISQ